MQQLCESSSVGGSSFGGSGTSSSLGAGPAGVREFCLVLGPDVGLEGFPSIMFLTGSSSSGGVPSCLDVDLLFPFGAILF